MRDFRKYDVWLLSHNLTLRIYEITKVFPAEERFGLISQMQRAAYSIPSNFAEGCGRSSDKDFDRFIQMSLGSAHELEYFLILSKDLKFLSEEIVDILILDLNLVKQKLYSLSKRLKGL